MLEVRDFLLQRLACCVAAGMERRQILLDPGFGFGKSVAHNCELLDRLAELAREGQPLLVGLSRKSLIAKVLAREVPPQERLPASLALAVLAVERGAAIVRTHDVAATVDALAMCDAIKKRGRL